MTLLRAKLFELELEKQRRYEWRWSTGLGRKSVGCTGLGRRVYGGGTQGAPNL